MSFPFLSARFARSCFSCASSCRCHSFSHRMYPLGFLEERSRWMGHWFKWPSSMHRMMSALPHQLRWIRGLHSPISLSQKGVIYIVAKYSSGVFRKYVSCSNFLSGSQTQLVCIALSWSRDVLVIAQPGKSPQMGCLHF